MLVLELSGRHITHTSTPPRTSASAEATDDTRALNKESTMLGRILILASVLMTLAAPTAGAFTLEGTT